MMNTKPRSERKDPKDLEKKAKRRGWTIAGSTVAVGVTAVAIALASPESCCMGGRSPEPIIEGPVRGDGICERDKGEGDRLSPNHAPEDCGWCGDGIQQPEENEKNCDVDFHCGNGKRDRRTVYYGFVKQKDGSLVHGVIRRTDQCNPRKPNFCKADCKVEQRYTRPPKKPPKPPKEIVPQKPPKKVARALPRCEGVKGTDSYKALDGALDRIAELYAEKLLEAKPDMKGRVKVYFKLKVSSDGMVLGLTAQSNYGRVDLDSLCRELFGMGVKAFIATKQVGTPQGPCEHKIPKKITL
jgi:hypothetical protein